ncbi:MAG: response regulator [Caldilineaceae bacterium]|nr:response regulator [Caldilineaceae bacterium]
MTSSLLVVDDDELVLASLTAYLQFSGYVVYPASNSSEALRLANYVLIDLVVSDLRPMGIDGYTLCRELYRLHHIPALLMSGFYENYEFKKAAWDICDFIRKPFLPNELENRIRTLLIRVTASPTGSAFTGTYTNASSNLDCRVISYHLP